MLLAYRALFVLLLLVITAVYGTPAKAQPFVDNQMIEGYPDGATMARFGHAKEIVCPTSKKPCEVEFDVDREAEEVQLRVYEAATRSLIYQGSVYRTKGQRKRAAWYKTTSGGKGVNPGQYPFLLASRPAGGESNRVSVKVWGTFVVPK